jgi:hypothetical protein
MDPELIKRKYASLTEDELIRISKTAKSALSKEAQIVLNEELKKRGLPVIFKDAPKDKSVQSPEELSYSDGWDMAFDQRKNGIEDADIQSALKDKGLSSKDIAQIFRTLPRVEIEDEEFINLVHKGTEKTSGNSNILLAVILVIFMIFCYLAVEGQSLLHFIIALLVGGLGYFIYNKSRGEFKSGHYWINLLQNNPGEFVWIKPIEVRHTVGYVIRLFSIKEFQFLTRHHEHITIVCDAEEDRKVFFRGIRNYLPHAHLGYSYEVSAIYEEGPGYFIKALEKRGLYRPAGDFDLKNEKAEV